MCSDIVYIISCIGVIGRGQGAYSMALRIFYANYPHICILYTYIYIYYYVMLLALHQSAQCHRFLFGIESTRVVVLSILAIALKLNNKIYT